MAEKILLERNIKEACGIFGIISRDSSEMIGAGTPLAELAETVWQDACFMRSIVIKARCKEEPESIVSPRMRAKAREIDASLEEMNGWIRRC